MKIRKTAPGLKNSLSLLKMSVQPGAAFHLIKTLQKYHIYCLTKIFANHSF